MSRIGPRFNQLRKGNRKGLVPFITAGDPVANVTVPSMHSLVNGGADMLELGVPFTDPEADGPAIQRSSERALANGITLSKTLDFVREFRTRDQSTPVILMGYLNPILAMGIEDFARRANDVGVDGVIIVNLPPEDARELIEVLKSVKIDLIMLVAPTSSQERMKAIVTHASGFIYFVSLKGITGSKNLRLEEIRSQIANIRKQTDLPVLLGFGVRTPQIAKEAGTLVDGVAVGTSIVETMANACSDDQIPDALANAISSFRFAMDD